MKFVRFQWQDKVQWGVVESDRIFSLVGDLYGDSDKGEELCGLQDVKLLAPAEPGMMIACALNYQDHIDEMEWDAPKEPRLFYKPANTLVGPLDEIHFPAISQDYRFEAELCVVMKNRVRNVTEDEAMDHVLGYACGNELGAYDLLKKDQNLTRARGFDTSGAMGPFLVTDIDDPHNLAVKARLNGETKQDSSTEHMIFRIPKLISHISAFRTLEPGDVIWTGTPKGGACPVNVGDVMEVEIEGLGILKNTVGQPK